MSQHDCDLLIVGAGMLGLAHAWAGAKRGLKVRVFERSHTPLGASIRNFGQALVTGQAPGVMLDLARQSRGLWAELGQAAGLQLKQQGSLLFARSEAEEALLEAFCAGRAREHGYRVELLRGAALDGLYGGRFAHHRAALHGLDDQQLYSREALPQIVDYLRTLGVQFHFSTLVRDVEPGSALTSAGRFSAKHIVVCSGHDYQTLLAEPLAALQPSVCRLQMLRARLQQPLDLQHAVLTGLSCVHYGAFADLPEAEAIRAQIRREQPELETHGIHLLVSPTPHGELIIGDSHDYGSDASPFNAEGVDDLMLALAEHTLGGKLQVLERWQGVYGSRGPGPFSVVQAGAGVSAVLMHTGLGMSVGLGLGERSLAALLGEGEWPQANAASLHPMSAEQAVAELFALCRQQAQADYIGEAVSQLEHMVQAAELARDEGADEELVLAAFCHDVGHFCAPLTAQNSMAGLGRRGHERVGANWLLGLGFSQRLAGLVARHVDAKRYLSWREPAYLAGLSAASRQTLHWQGGPMTTPEAKAFEADPLFADSLRLRRWDEAAKVAGRPPTDLSGLEQLAIRVHQGSNTLKDPQAQGSQR